MKTERKMQTEMRKRMKKHANRTLLACILALPLLAGCGKEERGSKVFVLQAPDGVHSQKTSLDATNGKTYWENGDVIYINGADADHKATVSVSSGGKVTAVAEKEIEPDNGRFYVCYPGIASIKGYDRTTHAFTFEMSAGRQIGWLKEPLVGINDPETKNIRFSHTCALLKVCNAENGSTIIINEAKNSPGYLTGDFTVTCTNGTWGTPVASGSSPSKTIMTSQNVGTADVYVPIPAGKHQLSVYCSGHTIAMGSAQDFAAGKIYRAEIPYHNGHEYVDLGLSVMWATCNVGASKPEDCGNYYAWAETATKTEYSFENSKYWNGATYTKYNPTYDTLTRLELADDAANVNWKGKWRMPTKAECDELISKCTWTYTTVNAVNGYEVKGSNGNSIFLPLTGFMSQNNKYGETWGYYWTSTLFPDFAADAYDMGFGKQKISVDAAERKIGIAVRPVFTPEKKGK